ncbi:JAB domain-containing protein [Tahibacter sp.]|uniref:JAB domain-containing protein n=1 Tax=Tahibacter sp. TaxID=2056211 RepID=UPI0028C3B686|nr:JAB domain-containing protein [Tahibacter sp.]
MAATNQCRLAKRTAHDDLVRRALRSLERRARRPGVLLNKPSVVADWFRLRLAEREHEVFAAAWLDQHHRLIAFEELFRGTINGAPVPVREVVKSALRHNAAAALFAHNHPSGGNWPSSADVAITREISKALSLIDVVTLDHFVVTATDPPASVSAVAPDALQCFSIDHLIRAPEKRVAPGKPKSKRRETLAAKSPLPQSTG